MADPHPQRCAICGWPLAESARKGCVRGNCSLRPFPDYFYDPVRALAEYAPWLDNDKRPPWRDIMSAWQGWWGRFMASMSVGDHSDYEIYLLLMQVAAAVAALIILGIAIWKNR